MTNLDRENNQKLHRFKYNLNRIPEFIYRMHEIRVRPNNKINCKVVTRRKL